MKRWLYGFLSGILFVFVFFIVLGMVGWYVRQRPPEVERNSTLILELEGAIPEQPPLDLPGQLLGEAEPIGMIPLLRTLERAATDDRIRHVLLKPRNLEVGWAKLEQLRQAVQNVRGTGKKVTALLDVAGTREYFVASAADAICLSPAGILNLKGMSAEVMFFKEGLAKIGVQADLEHIGAYKNFSDQFTEERMTPAFREATSSMLDSIYGNFIRTVAEARGKSPEEMRALIEQSGPFEAERAQVAGLVDELQYEDQVLDDLKQESGEAELRKIEIRDYQRAIAEDWQGGGERIALVYAVGTITSGEDTSDPVGVERTMGADTMAEILEKIAADESIRGVLVRIDSPGGDAFASDDIWRRMVLLRDKKPLVFSMSDTAASGGYYIAMTGDPIVAQPGTLTGSIGIIYGKLNLKGLYDKLGINKEILIRGPFSDMDSDYGAYTPEERARVRTLMNDFYQDFITKAGAARKKTPEEIDRIAQGRVWTGEQAVENGLVDELGGYERALELLKQKAGIDASAAVQLVEFPERKTLWELLLSRAEGAVVRMPEPLARWFAEWKQVDELGSRPLWTWLPMRFEFE
jgi:protease-4